MTYWLIQFKDGSFGYQVMSDAETVVTDINGLVVTGIMEYTTINTEPAGPFPEVTRA